MYMCVRACVRACVRGCEVVRLRLTVVNAASISRVPSQRAVCPAWHYVHKPASLAAFIGKQTWFLYFCINLDFE